MNRINDKPILNITSTQIVITILSMIAVVFTLAWEIPQIDFPKTAWDSSMSHIDYWKDIFIPAISVPLFFYGIVTGLNLIWLFLSFRFSKRRNLYWVIGVSISTFVDILLMWASMIWVRNAVICIADNLRYGSMFGCVYIFQPRLWQIVIGVIISILIVAARAVWSRRSLGANDLAKNN